MCKLKKYHGTSNTRIDECMRIHIHNLNLVLKEGVKIVACCCGHKKYPMTIILNNGREIYDLVSGEVIPRIRNFYKKDGGYYYIPEVSKPRFKTKIIKSQNSASIIRREKR